MAVFMNAAPGNPLQVTVLSFGPAQLVPLSACTKRVCVYLLRGAHPYNAAPDIHRGQC